MERLSQQALKDTDILWRSVLSDGTDSVAETFLAGAGQTFTNELGNKQQLFTTSGNQLFRPEMFADTADPTSIKSSCRADISRDLSSGLLKELKDSGIALKDGAVSLYDAAKKDPGAVFGGILSSLKDLPAGALESFQESAKAIGEGAAVALNPGTFR